MEHPRSKLIVMAPTPPPVFGQSVLTVSLLASLRRLGLLAAHVDTRDDRSLANLNRFDLVNVRLGLAAAWRLIGAMRHNPRASVYVQVSQGRWGFLRDALWIWLARLGRRRVYVQLHGGCFHEFHEESAAPLRALIAATVAQAHELWVLTPRLRRCFEGLAPPERIRVVENVVEEPAAPGGPFGPRRGEGGGLRVLFLSNLRPGKGHDDLLEALARLGSRAAGWQVRIVGDCDERARATAEAMIASRIDPSVRVDVTGPLTGAAKAAELAWANAFAFPSRYRREGQPLVILEALAAGLPIVTTRIGGIADTVRNGAEAILIDPGDIGALAAALERLAAEPELREEMGEAARERYERRYAEHHLDDALERALTPRGAHPEDAAAGIDAPLTR